MLRIPTPEEKNSIEIAVARRLGGMPRDSFPQNHVVDTTVRVTLDTIIDDCSDPDFKVWDCYDSELLYEVYNQYREFSDSFMKRLKR